MNHPIAMILMGTGPFAVPSFESIRAVGHDIKLVVTRPAPPVKSRGGGPVRPVHQWATDHQLPIWAPDNINDPDAIERLVRLNADLMVVCDYGQILKPAALAATRWGGINLHGSLLPAYRGAAPVQRALLGGESETGVSLIHMTPRLDGGPIVATSTTPISKTETAGELEDRLSKIGVDATMRAIDILTAELASHRIGEPLPLIGLPQDADRVSKAPRLSKSEAEIDWSKTADQIDCLVRGMQPWPVAFTMVPVHTGKPPVRLAIRRVVPDEAADTTPGQIGRLLTTDSKQEVAVGCGRGRVVIERVQPAGKKEMDAIDFLNGHRLGAGDRFGVEDV